MPAGWNGARSERRRWLRWLQLTIIFLPTRSKRGRVCSRNFSSAPRCLRRKRPDRARQNVHRTVGLWPHGGRADSNQRARFLAGMLGPENAGNLGYFYFFSYYLCPREVAISSGQPPAYSLTGSAQGHNPASLDELSQEGYSLVLQLAPDGRLESRALKPLEPPASKPPPIAGGDEAVAFLLPLSVALAGTRVIQWLFKELKSVLSSETAGVRLGARHVLFDARNSRPADGRLPAGIFFGRGRHGLGCG